MKILFTCVGRRVELLQAFRKASNKLNIDLTIIGTEITNDAPALSFCDKKYMTYRIDDEKYINQLLDICKEEKVDLIIPTIDTDLPLLSKNKLRFEKNGTKILVSDADKVEMCSDKKLTGDYFLSLKLKSPITFDSVDDFKLSFNRGDVKLPAFIKPRNGHSAIDAYKVLSMKELELYANVIDNYVIQPFVSGTEYTVDVFCDYEGSPIYITPRERMAIRGGEVLKSKIVQDDIIISEIKMLVNDFKPCGAITVQLIRDSSTKDNYYIEINPRFGGGVPISMKSGADSAEAVLRILRGEKLDYMEKSAEDGLIYSRYDQSICVSGDDMQ